MFFGANSFTYSPYNDHWPELVEEDALGLVLPSDEDPRLRAVVAAVQEDGQAEVGEGHAVRKGKVRPRLAADDARGHGPAGERGCVCGGMARWIAK